MAKRGSDGCGRHQGVANKPHIMNDRDHAASGVPSAGGFVFSTQLRVRYAETDQMGFVYYGNYPQYYEVARAEAMRHLGMTYKEMEENGVVMPIATMHIKYIRPARYDDLLTIKTIVPEMPSSRMHFDYEIYNENGDLLNKGTTVLAFLNKHSGRPCPAPAWFLAKLEMARQNREEDN